MLNPLACLLCQQSNSMADSMGKLQFKVLSVKGVPDLSGLPVHLHVYGGSVYFFC